MMERKVGEVTLRAEPLKDGSGWHVRVLPSGLTIGDFASEDEAMRWIETDAEAWLKQRQG